VQFLEFLLDNVRALVAHVARCRRHLMKALAGGLEIAIESGQPGSGM